MANKNESSSEIQLRSAWAHFQADQPEAAEAILRHLLRDDPLNALAMQIRGLIAHRQGRLAAAAELLSRAVELAPNVASGHSNLAMLLAEQGRIDQAVPHFERAVTLNADAPEAHNNLGAILSRVGELDRAIAAYQTAIALRPDYAEAHDNLGIALRCSGRLLEAVASHRRALALAPANSSFLTSLAWAYEELGRSADALDCRRRVVLQGDCTADAHSAFLYDLHLGDPAPQQILLDEHRDWARRYAGAFRGEWSDAANQSDPERRLRIGYVSADFRDHAVGRFVAPILAAHDSSRVEVFCYSSVIAADAMTYQIRTAQLHWREVRGIPDAALAGLIRSDRIDVLVDLSGHTAGNRLPAFARRPAPVQVTYLGYPDTTGMAAIDYRITDAIADPPGLTEAHHVERLFRLARCAWCYPRPAVAISPYATNADRKRDRVMFGTPNRICKLGPRTIALWANLLRAVPESSFLVIAAPDAGAEFCRRFAERGIDPARVQVANRGTEAHYWSTLQRIDIALDPLAYNGTGTTCDLLWAGVPIVTMAGDVHAARVGASLLSIAGLTELIAPNPASYIALAAELARDAAQREDLRAKLADYLPRSPLADGRDLAHHLERAYRDMWRAWCAARFDKGN